MASFVLVHGGSHGSWCWDHTATELRQKGHVVHAIDLPGRDSVILDLTLESWVEHLGNALADAAALDNVPPILVAHSMGGLTASQFAEHHPDAVRSIVYVCAVTPADGESGLEAFGEAGLDSELLHEGALVPSADGRTLEPSADAAERAFYNRTPSAIKESALAQVCAEYVVPLTTPLTLGSNFDSVRKYWISASDDRTVPPALQQKFANRLGAPMVELDSDHSPFLSAPIALADELDRLSAQL